MQTAENYSRGSLAMREPTGNLFWECARRTFVAGHHAQRGGPFAAQCSCFRSGSEAGKQGFHRCLRCKPNEKSTALRLVERAARELAQPGDEIVRVAALARSWRPRHPRCGAHFNKSPDWRSARRKLPFPWPPPALSPAAITPIRHGVGNTQM
jgi:hypothetical protein